jgi:hypothetical protein
VKLNHSLPENGVKENWSNSNKENSVIAIRGRNKLILSAQMENKETSFDLAKSSMKMFSGKLLNNLQQWLMTRRKEDTTLEGARNDNFPRFWSIR